MILSDVSIKRPVFATVISLVLLIFGAFSFQRLSVREYPNIDPPVVSIVTVYKGASAQIIETQVTQILEDAVAGIEGIDLITSSSREGSSRISIEFRLNRDIDGAANDVRDAISRVIARLPDEADPPVVAKAESDASPILWYSMTSETMSQLELSDYAKRYIVDRLSTISGVSSARVGGAREYAMRVWLDRRQMAARGITVSDVEAALRRQNVELPAGRIESTDREFTVRTDTGLSTPDQFARLVVAPRTGYPIKLGDVALVELAAQDTRGEIRNNGKPAIGVGVVKQSTANTLSVAEAVRAEIDNLIPTLPAGTQIDLSFDQSIFIEQSIYEVFHALSIALALVVAVIFVFLRSLRATIIPAVAIPVSIIASFMVLDALGFSINILTLLALVLAIGLVVDDAIVVLENIYRRIEEGEPPLLAAYNGARQIGFAVVATTLVLVAVFVPISFMEGNVGRLFTEFGITVAASVLFSGLVALTLTPMMCSKLLRPASSNGPLFRLTERGFVAANEGYRWLLTAALNAPVVVIAILGCVTVASVALFLDTKKEFSPTEDRGYFTIRVSTPEGSTIDYTRKYLMQIEQMMQPYVESGVVSRVFANLAPGWGRPGEATSAVVFLRLAPWSERTVKQQTLVNELLGKVSSIPGARIFVVNPPGLGQRGFRQPIQVTIGGSSYEELAEWRDQVLERLGQNPGLINVNADYQETKPELRVSINRMRANDLGVSVEDIGKTLETLLGSRNVTTFSRQGQEYNVVLQAADADRTNPRDLENVFVRSQTTQRLIPLSNLITLVDGAGPSDLNRVDRLRALTIGASLAADYSLGEALDDVEAAIAEVVPPHARIGYLGESREFKNSSASLYITFALALVIVFLVLAAQFESYVHPFVIMLSVPLAVAGALGAIHMTGITINVYSQIAIIMLVGLVAKNGILIVEFSNQLRSEGQGIMDAVATASVARFRPIVMTSITTVFGAMPLVLASGAGAESRQAIGIVIAGGIIFSTLLTLFVVPVFYSLLAGYTKPSTHVRDMLHALEDRARALTRGGSGGGRSKTPGQGEGDDRPDRPTGPDKRPAPAE